MRNLKKVIALVAVFAMLVSSVAFAGTFSDVAETDNYAKAIETLSALGIITGDDQDEDGVMDFRPEDTITRAEVTAIISRIQGVKSAAAVNTEFTDVPATHWASGYVAQAAGQGIVNGYGDGTFGPEDNVTYEQMIKMLMETLGYRPFANENGGYPTGYTTAAGRYGVLDDVIGGGIGVEASRGMVAQMVYNAIDTPLMDATSYGDEKNYGVFDGINRAFQTLLTRDLKLVKFTGIVTKNSYTNGVNTAVAKEVSIDPDDVTANAYYLGTGNLNEQSFYQGEVDADAFVGCAVEAYAKKNTTGTKMTLVALTASASVEEVSFDLGQFVKLESGKVVYKPDMNSTTEYKEAVEADAIIIYNGVVASRLIDDNQDSNPDNDVDKTLQGYFGNLIKAESDYSGNVTLLDTDDVLGADVIRIDLAVSGVVDKVSARGLVDFYNTVKVPYPTIAADGTLGVSEDVPRILYDAEATDMILNVTKNGEAIEYTEMAEWDVVSIIWYPGTKVFNLDVLGEANIVDGSVTVVRDNGAEVVLSDGNTYEIAKSTYGVGTVKPGLAGRFYIDAYGKIVALDKSVEIEGISTVADKYAYVIGAQPADPLFGQPQGLLLQILDKSGEVYEAKTASTFKVVNFDQYSLNYAGSALTAEATPIDPTKFVGTEDADMAAALINTMIAYEGNSNGQIKTIVAPQSASEDEALYALAPQTSVKFDPDTMNFGGTDINVTEDTIVFYVKGDSAITYGGAGAAKVEKSSVSTAASLVENTYSSVRAYDLNENEEVAVLLLLNQDGQYNPANNLAVIDSVGTSIANGIDTVYTVNYYINGELKTATTKVDVAGENDIKVAQRGDLFKLTVDGTTITNIQKVAIFDRTVDPLATPVVERTEAYVKDAAAVDLAKGPAFDFLASQGGTGKEQFYFGAVTRENSASYTVTFLNNTGATITVDSVASKNVREGSANVYVYDPKYVGANRLSIGSFGEAYVDDDLTKAGKYIFGGDTTINSGDDTLATGTAYGMMDYAFVRYYDGVVSDIVVYKNYDFGNWNVED